MYQIKAHKMLIQMQEKSFRFDNEVFLGGTLNWILALNFGEILREFGEILGKCRMLDVKSVGSKGKRLITIIRENKVKNTFLFIFS